MLILALIILLYYGYQLLSLTTWHRFRFLQNTSMPEGGRPLVTVILAARNEEGAIGDTLSSLLMQDYRPLEIVAVDDRSEDGTRAEMERIMHLVESGVDRLGEKGEVRLKIVHIDRLPQGWLGKNHALYQGYLHAKGDMLLFTDADIFFRADTLTDAVGTLLTAKADHLALTPQMKAETFGLRLFFHYFMFSVFLWAHPWNSNHPKSRKSAGIGAFNLIRRTLYERIGTHRSFSMHPIDDLRLGEMVKKEGGRQRFLSGIRYLSVAWYPSLTKALEGLEKNLFPVFHYRLWLVGLAAAMQAVLLLLPYAGVWAAHGTARLLFAAEIVMVSLVYVLLLGKLARERVWAELPFLPVSVLLLIYAMLRSAVLFIRRRGIYWRGTFYGKAQLMEMQQPKKQR